MNHWICTTASTEQKEMAHCCKYYLLVKKTACGGEQRGAWGNAPKSGLIFLLFLPYHWLDQSWWMMEGGRGGWAVDRTCSQSCPSLQYVGKTTDCCVWATEERRAAEEEGMVDALGQTSRVAGWGRGCPEQQSKSKKEYRRFSCWHQINMYVLLCTCLEDIPPAQLNHSKLDDSI